jgi:hypothetical protein
MIRIYNEDDFIEKYRSNIVLVKKVEKVVSCSKINFTNNKQDFEQMDKNNETDDFSLILEEQIKKMK